MPTDESDDVRDDLAEKRFDKRVRDAGGSPLHAEGKHGFLIGAHGKSDDEMFDSIARMLGADPQEMRRIAWEEGWGPDHDRIERRRFEIVCQHCDERFKAARRDARYCSDRCRQRARRKRGQ